MQGSCRIQSRCAGLNVSLDELKIGSSFGGRCIADRKTRLIVLNGPRRLAVHNRCRALTQRDVDLKSLVLFLRRVTDDDNRDNLSRLRPLRM